jgi:hypothetical protein
MARAIGESLTRKVSNVSENYKLYVENSPGENKFGVQLSSNSIILYNDKDDDSFSADKD